MALDKDECPAVPVTNKEKQKNIAEKPIPAFSCKKADLPVVGAKK